MIERKGTAMHDGFRRARAMVALLAALALSSCMLAPGRFTSTLDLRRDGRFDFAYSGEIAVLALARPPDEARGAFRPTPCHDKDGAADRPCRRDELDSQKRAWEEARARSDAGSRREAEAARAMFGGLDFDDPRAPEDLAQRLRQQQGWRRVEYRGRGVYWVEYAASGALSQDFTFPTIERFALATPFVQLIRRADGAVRVDAPAFSTAGTSLVNMMMMGAASAASARDATGPLPSLDGVFTLTTDGEVLANNTENGPRPASGAGGGKQMTWRVTTTSAAAPMALIQLRN